MLKLIGMKAELAAESARELIARTREELADANAQRKFIELIETVFVYKFPDLSREEIEAMFGLNELKQTKVYQEAKAEGVEEGRQEGLQEGLQEGRQEGLEEGKLAAVPLLLKAGIKPEDIAQQLGLDLAAVQKIAQQ
ncbi:MAG: DUF2887 domain-containing protein [Calothrix sp. MO_167.B42]|nr:DUF2887 domain-containing protein [Calothrix sp. MO_167.B42]